MKKIRNIYDRLFDAFGPQHWWPGDTPFEIAVGAILTQNTNWSNVEKAIANLKKEGLMNFRSLHASPHDRIAKLIRPSGYFNIKAKRLRNFMEFMSQEYNGSLRQMMKKDLPDIRRQLLSVSGIGPETADSIILYALGKPVFVIDAYTKRVLSRHNILDYDKGYAAFQQLFHGALPEDAGLFNEYHALFVRLAKEYCRTKPLCEACPLKEM